MVGIVLVAHSRPLAEAVRQLVQAMTGSEVPLAIAAGAGEDRADLGTDATEIMQAVELVSGQDGAVVLMDMGGAVLSAETAMDLLDQDVRSRVRLCAAPLVEGALAAGVAAKVGSSLEEVCREAERAMTPKQQHLQVEPVSPSAAASAPPATAALPTEPVAAVVRLPNAHGLHARPASVLVQQSAKFDADVRVENTSNGKGPVSARSVISLALLEAVQGHALRISATGPQAQEAVDALRALVESGLGDLPGAPAVAAKAVAGQASHAVGRAQPIAAGIAVGEAVFYEERPVAMPKHRAENVQAERAALREAINSARSALLEHKEQAQHTAGSENAEIFAAQAMLLDDPTLVQMAEEMITTDRLNAALAWQRSVATIAAKYRELTDETLRHRAVDVEDVGRRVLEALGVKGSEELPIRPESILVVNDLTPTQATRLSAESVAGVICLDGGQTSHSAILLRALGIASIAQARPMLEPYLHGEEPLQIAFDGHTGEIWIGPDEKQLAKLRSRQEAWKHETDLQIAAAHEPAVTNDGRHIEVSANVGKLADAEAAMRFGAEGVGLLRTEFLFLDRPAAPGEQRQIDDLQPIIKQMRDRPVVVRTLDVGGDKEVPYLKMAREANPFLGVRALRLSLRRPKLFMTQLRALLRVGVDHDVRIMFPMVSGMAELQAGKKAMEDAHRQLEQEGVKHLWPVRTGIMVEIPSAAVMAEELAGECDFLSIGTNDLTQYALAADRANPELAELQDALHPAVLRLISQTVEGAHRRQRPVAVCGEAAGDIGAALLLIGLGVDELSMNPAGIPAIKAAIRRASAKRLHAAACRALECTSAEPVRRLAEELIQETSP